MVMGCKCFMFSFMFQIHDFGYLLHHRSKISKDLWIRKRAWGRWSHWGCHPVSVSFRFMWQSVIRKPYVLQTGESRKKRKKEADDFRFSHISKGKREKDVQFSKLSFLSCRANIILKKSLFHISEEKGEGNSPPYCHQWVTVTARKMLSDRIAVVVELHSEHLQIF